MKKDIYKELADHLSALGMGYPYGHLFHKADR